MYGANGLKETFSMPGGPTFTYHYGQNRLLSRITIPGVGDIGFPSHTMGRPDTVVFPSGVQQDYSYDPMMRLNGITAQDSAGETLLNYSYTHDSVSNILTKVTEHGNYRYGYDETSRLTDVENPVPLFDEVYSYDGVGNRLSASGVNGAITHNANNELEQYGELTYEYDANGNMVRRSTGAIAERYVYNIVNRLIRIEDEATGSLIAEYGYDPFGRRLWKEVGGVRTYFFYSDEGLVAEYDAQGTELRAYGYKPDSTWTTNPLWLKQGGEYYWYLNDHLGMPQKLVDMAGTVVWSAQYYAFGQAQILVKAIENNLRFPGQYVDAESGLHYNWNRYYDPVSGRYVQIDPIGFDGGDINLYGYARKDPVNSFDPRGLSAKDVKRILGLFHNYVTEETQAGRRHPLSGWNNLSNLINLLTLGTLGTPYKPCTIQWMGIEKVINDTQFDDIWSAKTCMKDDKTHVWGYFQSDKPEDPIIIADPWSDKITQVYTPKEGIPICYQGINPPSHWLLK